MGNINLNTIYSGDALEVLTTLPDKSINCCVSSPPYYGLRDYGVDGQIGKESSPEEFVSKLTEIFMEVHRVLRDDGTLWVVIGDCYASSGKGALKEKDIQREVYNPESDSPQVKMPKKWEGIKPKDLIGIPWTFALSMRKKGWYLRQDIIWHKPNTMPESTRDRCTKSHEYIFLFSKKSKYYYDVDAIREPHKSLEDLNRRIRNGTTLWKTKKAGEGTPYCMGGVNRDRRKSYHPLGRNKRSVWNVHTTQCKEAHFAIFPEKLIEDCVKAGCPENGVVLDPFMGAGTTAIVARKLNRNYVGIEINPDYIEISKRRIENIKLTK